MGAHFKSAKREGALFTETLSKETKAALDLLSGPSLLSDAYLAGGTACALQIGHRISVDLDFFTPKEFEVKMLIRSLQKIGDFRLIRESWGTVLGNFNGVQFSLFVYDYPVIQSFQKYGNINVASLQDLGAMKIDAISSRGLKRDFIDLYFICHEGLSLSELFESYDKKFGNLSSNIVHLQKSLVYFEDADVSPDPNMLKPMEWERVKNYFQQEVRQLALVS